MKTLTRFLSDNFSNFLNEFIQEINSQKNKIKNTKSNEYKEGLCDELDFIKDLVNDNNNK